MKENKSHFLSNYSDYENFLNIPYLKHTTLFYQYLFDMVRVLSKSYTIS